MCLLLGSQRAEREEMTNLQSVGHHLHVITHDALTH